MKSNAPFSMKNLLIIAAVLQVVWGLVPSASKYVIDEIPVELYITLRWTISGLIFAVYVLISRKWQTLSLKDFSLISLLGILGYGLASIGTLYGLKIGGVVNFALVAAMGPILTSFVSMSVLKERPQKKFYLALLLSVVGLLLLAIGKYQVSSFTVAGTSVALILGACILEALVFVFSKKFKNRVSTVQYLTITQTSAAAVMWVLQGFAFHQTSELALLSLRGVVAALFVSIVACVLCYAILYWLLQYIDGHRLALFDGFHALSATLFGFILFSEPLGPAMAVGGVLVISGLVLGNLPSQEEVVCDVMEREKVL